MKAGSVPKPIAVLISDIHYNLPNLELADAAMRQAIKKANELDVKLWVAGDIHDTKANMRSEVVRRMIATFEKAVKLPEILVGNHDKDHEKADGHALEFLDGKYARVISKPVKTNNGTHFIPYTHDTAALRDYLNSIEPHSTLIMHQGIHGSDMGDYVLDKSAISPNDVAGHRVISGHYHARQTIDLPNGGKWDYIGNPYTVSYGEANDPEKGYQILMSDGSLEFVPTNLRKHIVINHRINELVPLTKGRHNPGDLIWIKATGTKEQISLLKKSDFADIYDLQNMDFRLDLIPTDTTTTKPTIKLSNGELLDSLIDSLAGTSDERKVRLKQLWKELK